MTLLCLLHFICGSRDSNIMQDSGNLHSFRCHRIHSSPYSFICAHQTSHTLQGTSKHVAFSCITTETIESKTHAHKHSFTTKIHSLPPTRNSRTSQNPSRLLSSITYSYLHPRPIFLPHSSITFNLQTVHTPNCHLFRSFSSLTCIQPKKE